MKSRPARRTLGTNGQAMIELALILPFLALLVLGVCDFSRAIHAKNVIINMSREGANLASRSSLAKQDIMDALACTAQPLDMQGMGMMYITTVQGVKNGKNVDPIIQSQEGWQNKSVPQSLIGTPVGSNPVAKNLGTLSLKDGDTIYVVEVFYDYRSLFSMGKKMIKSQLYSMTIF